MLGVQFITGMRSQHKFYPPIYDYLILLFPILVRLSERKIKKALRPCMGRKACFRDTTQIDRLRDPLKASLRDERAVLITENGFLPQAPKCFSRRFRYRFSPTNGSL
jgi:hypothetical protein